jgi:hypothetical protein
MVEKEKQERRQDEEGDKARQKRKQEKMGADKRERERRGEHTCRRTPPFW